LHTGGYTGAFENDVYFADSRARLIGDFGNAVCCFSCNGQILIRIFSSLHGYHKAVVCEAILYCKVDSSGIDICNDDGLCSLGLRNSCGKQTHSASSKD